jgi:hypothetical protein
MSKKAKRSRPVTRLARLKAFAKEVRDSCKLVEKQFGDPIFAEPCSMGQQHTTLEDALRELSIARMALVRAAKLAEDAYRLSRKVPGPVY